MRVIGSIIDETNAHHFGAFLSRRGIENRVETAADSQSGQSSFQIWIADEDRIDEANEFLKRFEMNPLDPLFNAPIKVLGAEAPPSETSGRRRSASIATIFFLALCVFVYLLNFIQALSMRQGSMIESSLIMTPIQTELLFDLPPVVEQFEKFFSEHPMQPKQSIEDLSPDDRAQLEQISQTPFWRGIYDWILLKAQSGDTSMAEGPLFTKIREGQLWRLFSPSIMHSDLLHILFNMIWLWVLGRPIEQRIGPWRTIFLTLAVGIISNTAQYLMSGPLFLGYSGVVMGLAGFIWMRERIAPWEGYPLQRSTILFLVFFVLAMLLLQMLSFFVQIFSHLPFVLSIANTAHIAGALIGALFGRLSIFAWRVK